MRYLPLLLLAFVSFIGCKKSEDTPYQAPGIHAKIQNSPVSFTAGIVSVKQNHQGMEVVAVAAETPSGQMLAIGVAKPGTLTTGVYTGTGSTGGVGYIEYNDGIKTYESDSDCVITVTHLDAASIRGTFSATVTPQSGGVITSITEGSFSIAF